MLALKASEASFLWRSACKELLNIGGCVWVPLPGLLSTGVARVSNFGESHS